MIRSRNKSENGALPEKSAGNGNNRWSATDWNWPIGLENVGWPGKSHQEEEPAGNKNESWPAAAVPSAV